MFLDVFLSLQCPIITIPTWSDEADAKLQDGFASTDWNMFWDSSDGVEEYTTSVTGFINKCIDDAAATLCNYLCIVTLITLPTCTYYLNYLDTGAPVYSLHIDSVPFTNKYMNLNAYLPVKK